MPSGEYKKVAEMVDNWLALNRSPGFTFQAHDIFNHYRREILTKDQKNDVMEVLWYGVNKRQNLEKIGRLYKYVNKDKKEINWLNASDKDEIEINWPKAHGEFDRSTFGFDGHVVIRPADILVVAGLSNWGKSTFCRNFLWENMDVFPCQMMLSEYAPGRFKSVVSRMKWNSPLNPEGKPKFSLIERHEDWKYAIEPDGINIIDWISLSTDFYLIRQIMEGIQENLRGGIALIVLQKREGRDLGEGGGMTEDRASVYFNIDQGVLTVRKVKESKGGINPTGTKYGFSIVNGGAEFANIRPVKICPKCGGKKTCWVKGEGTIACPECNELGFVEKR
jgi:hypothetical protein